MQPRKHVGNIFGGLGLQPADENRRVRAILLYLQDRSRRAKSDFGRAQAGRSRSVERDDLVS